MQLEAYLDFVGPDEIRLRGHRIGIEHVIEYYKAGYSPEQIAEMFSGVALEQVYAAITYYLHYQVDMDAYFERQQDRYEQQFRAWAAHPSPAIIRLRRLLKLGLRRRAPAFDVLRVGEEDAPHFGTLDPEILRYLASAQRLLLTNNRASMPEHVATHLAAGHHHWGVFRIRPGASLTDLIDAALLLWEASAAEEWIDALEWLPFG